MSVFHEGDAARGGASLFCAACWIFAFNAAAAAQDVAPSPAARSAIDSSLERPPEEGLAVGSWMLYPSLFVGVVFNDNHFGAATNRKSSTGVRIRPALAALRDDGLHKTSFFASGDLQFYPGLGGTYQIAPGVFARGETNAVTAHVGALHVWSPTPDLQVSVLGEFARQSGLFGSDFGASAWNVNVPSTAPLSKAGGYSNQFTGMFSVQKTFDGAFFLRATVGGQYIGFDNPNRGVVGALPTAVSADNGGSYGVSVRAGFWLTPLIYAFVEPAADFRRYDRSILDSNGYSIVGGFGSDLIGLTRGEIYAGYGRQHALNGGVPSVSSPLFGARFSYFPTRDITVTVAAEQRLTSAGATALSVAAASRTITGRLQADYAMTPYLTVFARGGLGRTDWSRIGRRDDLWTVGAGLNYTFWRNLALSLEYQYNRVRERATNVPAGAPVVRSSYRQNVLSAGITYRY